MTTGTHLQFVRPPASDCPARPADGRVRYLGRWTLMNHSHFDYLSNLWWHLGYRTGVDAAAKGEHR